MHSDPRRNNDAFAIALATSLIYFEPPRNHIEAKAQFDSIIKRKPTCTLALVGIGLILEEEEDFIQAFAFLGKALERDPDNVRIRTEAAWCKALNGDYSTAL